MARGGRGEKRFGIFKKMLSDFILHFIYWRLYFRKHFSPDEFAVEVFPSFRYFSVFCTDLWKLGGSGYSGVAGAMWIERNAACDGGTPFWFRIDAL